MTRNTGIKMLKRLEKYIDHFKSKGYEQWGTNPRYAQVAGNIIKGLYFYKNI